MNFKPYLSHPSKEFMHLLQSLAWVSIIHWVIVWCLTPYRQYVSYCQPYKGVSIIILRIIDWLSDWLIDWLIDWLNRILRHIGNISAIQQRIWVCVISHFVCNYMWLRCHVKQWWRVIDDVSAISIRRFRDRHSSVMEVILVLMHSQWWDKVKTPYMEYVVYICFKISFAYFA